MLAATPSPAPSPPPAKAPAAPAPAPAPPSAPRAGEVRDSGTVRRDSVDSERWVATGLVKVTGDVRIGEGRLDGTVSVGGQFTATTVRLRGTLEVGGAVTVTDALVGSGTIRPGSTLRAGTLDLQGDAPIPGALTVDRSARVRGSLAAASATVGELDLEGELHVLGDLVSPFSVAARLKGDSEFGTVRAKSVSLRARLPNLVEKVFGGRVTVTVRRVETESAEFEGVDVEFVRAPKIVLGRDAHVTAFEGTIVKRHPSSRVGFESKSPPPYGLRR